MDLLSIESDAKTSKGSAFGWLTAIIYMISGSKTICPFATDGCINSCLRMAGHGTQGVVMQAREFRTRLWDQAPDLFLFRLEHELQRFLKRAEKAQLRPCFRPNGTSDIRKLIEWSAERFPDLMVYGYTKNPRLMTDFLDGNLRPNVHITWSHSERPLLDPEWVLDRGGTVTVVLDSSKDDQLPKRFRGYPMIDGRIHDLRFLDKPGHYIGLSPLGPATKDDTGFVIRGWKEAA